MTEERAQNRGPNCSRDTSKQTPCVKKAICPNCYSITELKIVRRSICIPNISSVICSFDTSNDQPWTGNFQWLRIFCGSLAIAGFVISVKILGLKFLPYIADELNRFAVVFPPVFSHFKTLIILNQSQWFKYKESLAQRLLLHRQLLL